MAEYRYPPPATLLLLQDVPILSVTTTCIARHCIAHSGAVSELCSGMIPRDRGVYFKLRSLKMRAVYPGFGAHQLTLVTQSMNRSTDIACQQAQS